ncbi:RING finger membrane protein [Ascosphaera apis ARSEF 7405]|uniref:RING-type E3 ubiquitin transferase n=1 Tax=Ascosphaera apis ARSEF 7405 TaxID=392613 RepID=A0A167VWN6_9EURO|nr:RING finger membrane protein [Ascosphaera apis ARSEF 7405]
MDLDDIFDRASYESNNPHAAAEHNIHNHRDNDDDGDDSMDDLHFNDNRFSSSSLSPDNPYDPDTCRICRSEGTLDDPLYHPCKCSGSIRYVHQSCLMEWLSHSQKKHCELCKTSFQFTRIYDPQMPAELPLLVFCRKLVAHVTKNVLFWLRCALVVSIWLGWLPFMMRIFWKGLFWLADGRWPVDLGGGGGGGGGARNKTSSSVARLKNLNSTAASIVANVSFAATVSTPPSISNTHTTPSSTSSTASSSSSSIFNFTLGDFLPRFMKKIFLNAAKRRGDASASFANRSSWLSDFAIFKSLTPYPTLNNIIIDILEGQIITLSVVISFVLLFLIREWVVQRQPIMGMDELQVGAHDVPPPPPAVAAAAAAAAAANGANGNHAQNEEEEEAEDDRRAVDHEDERQPETEEQQRERRADRANYRRRINLADVQRDLAGDIYRHYRRETGEGEEEENQNRNQNQEQDREPERETTARVVRIDGGNDVVQVPISPEVTVFQDVWVRSNGDPETIVRIIRDEELHQLDWVLPIMQRMTLIPRDEVADAGEEHEDDNRENDDDVAEKEVERDDNENRRDEEIENTQRTDESSQVGESHWEEQVSSPVIGVGDFSDYDFTRGPPSISSSQQEVGDSSQHVPNASSQSVLELSDNDNPDQTENVENRLNEEERENELHNGEHAHDASTESMESDRQQQEGEEEEIPELIIHDAEGLGSHEAEHNVDNRTWIDRLFDFFWGDLPPLNPPIQREPSERDHRRRGEEVDEFDEDRLFEEVDDEEEVDDNNDDLGAENDALDIDAIDDADDLEGILELIGVHGPLMNLFQNAVFSTLLVSFTVAAAIWLPYLWGKIALVLLTNPIRLFVGVPIATMSIVADIIVDTCIGSFGYIFYFASLILRVFLQPISKVVPLPWYSGANKDPLSSVSLSLVNGSGMRLKRLMDALISFNDADLPVFSMVAHKALLTHQNRIKTACTFLINFTRMVLYDVPLSLLETHSREGIWKAIVNFNYTAPVKDVFNFAINSWKSFLPLLDKSKWTSIKANEVGSQSIALDYQLAHWGTRDRLIAVLVGYCFVALLCMLYLHTRSLFHSPETDPPESAISEALRQAGGVLKVIFIVGIEMIVFPLYCGLLLDLALMPLFEKTTLASRVAFTLASPMTSLFVHWFVGTCYMFHFALFVSMCRKLMRKGVLYFIRDPDDPTFHPVRDVLERSISTQLRKIGFSALIYSALIMVCCGGVVWSLHFTTANVLPLRWTSHHPMLEVPVDLLFYNFIMPVATKQLKISDWMYSMYGWWFCKCARMLRLSQFLLGKRRRDEEGHLVYQNWRDALFNRKGARYTLKGEDGEIIPATARFVKDGRYVRAPASDQVRIPKEFTVFLEVTEDDRRLDGKPDRDEGIHGRKSKNFTKVYVPPHFKARIMTFVFLIWMFVATTGVVISISPLLVGRWAISWLVPAEIQVNDIYAFSTGVYILGTSIYVGYQCYKAIERQKRRGCRLRQSLLQYLKGSVSRILGSVYLLSAFVVVLPSLFAMMMELYFLIPLHTTLAPEQEHVVYSVQDWALGVLYLRMAICIILSRSRSRPAQALRAIIRKGWLSPDVRLATRAFILPATLLSVTSILAPIALGFSLNMLMFRGPSEDSVSSALVYRAAYPAALGIFVGIYGMVMIGQKIKDLRTDLRDDVYLIGERLHNFQERPAQDMGASRPMMGI